MINDENILTFTQLVERYKVAIPIIQRDYAQGRQSNEQLCRTFLQVLMTHLLAGTSINLDFIYGNLKEEEFHPLDGQQRLTTLYLLHWYAFHQECPDDAQAKGLMMKFTYETRMSSRRFCEALVSSELSIGADTQCVSDLIKNAQWFFSAWNQDSTVRAMLNTIDYIHELFKDVPQLWTALSTKGLITFHLLILEHFGLSDDLYIKMNARGRLLTPFENFKAELQGKIQKEGWEEGVAATETFLYKLDTVWTDFLWKNFRKDNAVDAAHMNFITALVMIASSTTVSATDRSSLLPRLNSNNSERDLIQYITPDIFKTLRQCYDLYSDLVESDQVPQLTMDMWRHTPKISLLHQLLMDGETSYSHKVLFWAQTQYLLRHKEQIDVETFSDWLRVIRNIAARADITPDGVRTDFIRSPDTFAGAINLINELSQGCNHIYAYLAGTSVKSAFSKDQMWEEKLKSTIITGDAPQKPLLHRLEDNELLRGKIQFALFCAGFQDQISQIDFQLLARIETVFRAYFNEEHGDPFEMDLLRRCMLTIQVEGQYKFYDYWWSYWNAGQAEKRKLFAEFREIERFIHLKGSETYLQKLILLLLEQNYNDIIQTFQKPETMPNWQYRLIKEEALLSQQCKSKYIAIADDNSYCYLLKTKRTADVEGSPRIE